MEKRHQLQTLGLCPERHASSCRQHHSALWAFKLVLIFSFFGVVAAKPGFLFDSSSVQSPFDNSRFEDLTHPTDMKTQNEQCRDLIGFYARDFYCDMPHHSAIPQNWSFVDRSRAESGHRLQGSIRVVRGDMTQSSDIKVKIVALSNKEIGNNFLVENSESGIAIQYKFSDGVDICTDIQVLVSLRPSPTRHVQEFKLQSEVLNIGIFRDLAWEANHLITHTTFGESWVDARGKKALIAHNVSMTSNTGNLRGILSYDGFTELHTKTGRIGFALGPRWNCPTQPERLSISTISGDVAIEAVTADDEYPIPHTTNIKTQSGHLDLIILHGWVTNITNIYGTITMVLGISDMSPRTDQPNQILTDNSYGDTEMNLVGGWLGRQYRPLSNTTSIHQVQRGKLGVYYSDLWNGTFEGRIEDGPLTVLGDSLKEVERNENYVKATKGEGRTNTMDARVEQGELKMRVGRVERQNFVAPARDEDSLYT